MQIETACTQSLGAPSHVIAISEAENQQKWTILNPYIVATTDINEKKFVFFEHPTYNLYHGHIHLFCLGQNFSLFFSFFHHYLFLNHKTHMDHTVSYCTHPKVLVPRSRPFGADLFGANLVLFFRFAQLTSLKQKRPTVIIEFQ